MLHHVRQALGLTQEKLAKQANIQARALRDLEAGRFAPRLDTAIAIVQAIKNRYDELTLHKVIKAGKEMQVRKRLPIPQLDDLVRAFLAKPFGFQSFIVKGLPGRPGGEDPEDEPDDEPEDPPPGGGKKPPKADKPDVPKPATQTHTPKDLKLRATVARNSWTTAEILQLEDAVAIYKRLKGDGTAAARSRLYDDIQTHCVWGRLADGTPKSHNTIQRQLRYHAGAIHRSRRKDPEVLKRKDKVAKYAGPLLARLQLESHQKGPDLKRSWGDQAPAIRAILRVAKHRERLRALYGKPITAEILHNILRANGYAAQPWEITHRAIQQTVGFRAGIAGKVMYLDATGVPAWVKGPWGRDTRVKDGKKGVLKRWIYGMCDLDSACLWMNSPAALSENPQCWNDALIDFAFRIPFIPERVIADRASGVWEQLRWVDENNIPLLPGVLLWLAMRIVPHIHESGRPTAGASVESNFRVAKNLMKEILGAKRLEEELRSGIKNSYLKFGSEVEYQTFMAAFEEEFNLAELKPSQNRAGGVRRIDLLNHEESVAWQQENRRAADAHEKWRGIVSKTVAGRLEGRTIRAFVDGKKGHAELLTEVPVERECMFLALPAGLRAGDDPKTQHVYVIEPSEDGRPTPRVHYALAGNLDRTWSSHLENKPLVGEHPVAAPVSAAMRTRKHWQEASREYDRRLEQIREGTTDEPVDEQPATDPW